MSYNLTENDIKLIAAATYGENRGQSDDAILHMASSMYNRLGNNEWQNMTVPEMLNNGYYAVRDTSKNSGYTDALNGKFPDKASENDYKRIYAKVSAINRGKLQPTDTQFYFKQSEINRLAKKKAFDFSKVDEGTPFMASVGGKKEKFRTFHYKK